jgi:formylglycine-generating enzyme required for sulfatase activity
MAFVWVPALRLWVGKYEVTNGEYRKMHPRHNSGSSAAYGCTLNGDRQPVVSMKFEDAKAYAEWLTESDRGGIGMAGRYRLPTQEEWLAIAQCGDGREYPWGGAMPPDFGNYPDLTLRRMFGNDKVISGYDDKCVVTCAVELSGKNPLGLYGVGGNVWECCASDASSVKFGGWRGSAWNCINFELLKCKESVTGGLSRDSCGFRLVLTR